MKKIVSAVTACLLALGSCVFTRAETEFTVAAKTDYAKNVICVEVASGAAYDHAVTVVLYAEADSLLRVGEGVTAGGKCTVEFKLGDDLATGTYQIRAAGSGIEPLSCTIGEYELLGLEDARAALAGINSAQTAVELEPWLRQVAAPLGIELDASFEDGKQEVLDTLIGMRKSDFSNAFSSLDDIRRSWSAILVIRQLNGETNPEALAAFFDANQELLGIDVTIEDYRKDPSGVCRAFLAISRAAGGVRSAGEAAAVFAEAVAVNAVNTSSVEDMGKYLTRYAKLLKVEPYLTEFSYRSDKLKIARALNGRNFRSAEEITAAFLAAMGKHESEGSGPSGGSHTSSGTGKVTQTITGLPPVATPTPPPEISFADMTEFEWAREPITALCRRGVLAGYEDDTFRGNKPVSRAEFVKMLVTGLGIETEGAQAQFADVEAESWAYPYIAAAAQKEIAAGYDDGSFGANDTITRQDAAVMAYRAVISMAIELDATGAEASFYDQNAIADYAAEGVGALAQAGVLSGLPDGAFHPAEQLSRAQAAKLIYGILN